MKAKKKKKAEISMTKYREAENGIIENRSGESVEAAIESTKIVQSDSGSIEK